VLIPTDWHVDNDVRIWRAAPFLRRFLNSVYIDALAAMTLPGALTMIPVYLIWYHLGMANSQSPLWMVNLFEPELVVLRGGVTRSGDQLLQHVRSIVRADAMAPAASRAGIVAAALGDPVGVVGAAAIVYDAAEHV
jgi:hypothetical protein